MELSTYRHAQEIVDVWERLHYLDNIGHPIGIGWEHFGHILDVNKYTIQHIKHILNKRYPNTQWHVWIEPWGLPKTLYNKQIMIGEKMPWQYKWIPGICLLCLLGFVLNASCAIMQINAPYRG